MTKFIISLVLLGASVAAHATGATHHNTYNEYITNEYNLVDDKVLAAAVAVSQLQADYDTNKWQLMVSAAGVRSAEAVGIGIAKVIAEDVMLSVVASTVGEKVDMVAGAINFRIGDD